MTGKMILQRRDELDSALKYALSNLLYKNEVNEIKNQFLTLQEICPHYDDELNWPICADGKCPYCGKHIKE